jgi:hypothetical protein
MMKYLFYIQLVSEWGVHCAHLHHSSMRVDTCRSTPSAFSGYAPMADSPLSISASARCRTTSAMSATCAHAV